VRYLDIENRKWSGNGMEIENAFEYVKMLLNMQKVVDM